jgi:hypothetical protein
MMAPFLRQALRAGQRLARLRVVELRIHATLASLDAGATG